MFCCPEDRRGRPGGEGPGAALRVAYVEGYWGGSHRAAAEGWAASSRHDVRLHHLPARFWTWRMRGAAFEFARRLGPRVAEIDVIFATSVLDLAHLLAFLPRRVPSVLYFHENQASFPARPGERPADRDLSYAFVDLAGALAADAVAFNSEYQRGSFLSAVGDLVGRMPDARPAKVVEAVRRKCRVLPLGVSLADIPGRPPPDGGSPVVLWNHRWEYDKAPEVFFRVLSRLAARGVAFRVVVLGQSFSRTPAEFERARAELGERVVRWGFAARREDYAACLARADVVVSTAIQENFGLSVVEAAYAGAHPLVPRRLAYPEVLPPELHPACLYEDEADLETRLEALLAGPGNRVAPHRLRSLFRACDWGVRAGDFDEVVSQVPGRAEMWYT